MKQRMTSLIERIGHEEFEVKEAPLKLAALPFDIEWSSAIIVDGDYISLIMGPCPTDTQTWHVFLYSRFGFKGDHPLDPLHPACSVEQDGIRLTTFNPLDISDFTLEKVIQKLLEAKADGKLKNFMLR